MNRGDELGFMVMLGLLAYPVAVIAQSGDIWMERHANTSVSGEVHQTTTGANIAACESRCLRDADCSLFEFRYPTQTCALFRKGQIAGEAQDHAAGVKRRPNPAAMQRLPNSYVEAEGYDTVLHSSPEACEAYCLGEQACLMSEFFKPDSANNRS